MKRYQVEGETVLKYNAQLKQLSSTCDFGETLSERLRDQLVVGIRSEAIQRRLLAETVLTYAKAIELATSMELADKDSKELIGSAKSAVNYVARQGDKLSAGSSGGNRKMVTSACYHCGGNRKMVTSACYHCGGNRKMVTSACYHCGGNRKMVTSACYHCGGNRKMVTSACYHCGGNNHRPEQCRYANAVCHQCNKRGHLQRVCRSMEQYSEGRTPFRKKTVSKTRPRDPSSVHHVEDQHETYQLYIGDTENEKTSAF